jgi:hypothetical protein
MSKQPLVVAVAGSPRPGGNTSDLLEAALLGAREEGATVEIVTPTEMRFVACLHCGGCNPGGVCVVQDAMQPVYELIERMDAMIMAAPIFFGNVPAQLKALIDRAQPLWVRKDVQGKPLSDDGKDRPLLFLSALASDQHDQIESTRTVIRSFAYTFDGEVTDLFFPGVEDAGEVAEDWTALGQAREAAASLVKHLIVK